MALGLPDYYTLRARLFPAIIAAAPALALATAWVSWDGLNISQLLGTIAICVVLYAFSDVARQQGKRVEPMLMNKMGGLPSTTMLRHRDTSSFKATDKDRYLTFIAKQLNEQRPTLEDEERDPAAADEFYARAGTWLRANTRDAKAFHILFEENITYGFRRNLYGLKRPALCANALIVVIVAIWLIWFLPPNWDVPIVKRFVAVLVIAGIHAVYLLLGATEAGAIQAAKQYARELILSTEQLMAASTSRTATRRT